MVAGRAWFLATLGALALSCGGNVIVDHGDTGGGLGGLGAGTGGSSGPPSCDAPIVAPSKGACFTGKGGCNPVTALPCAENQGDFCDIGTSGFTCFPDNTQNELCEACDKRAGLFCSATLTCLPDGKCARYCCDDGDCGSGRCDTSDPALQGTGVGVCKAT